ncbi:MAG: sortase [Methanobrevibacter sp.]|nr:sortase [Candidatus Methanovirga meridionalis]
MDNTSKEPSKGKVVLHGHRTLLGSPFLRLNELKQGDNISLNWPGIGKVNYVVDKSYIIIPDYRISLVNHTNNLYMVTCDSVGSTARRLIVESSYLDTKPLDSTVNRMNYNMMILLMLVGFFIIGFIVSYFYPVKEDRKFLFVLIVLITMILLGLIKYPIYPVYFSFLVNIGLNFG